ncbi:MAG: FAD-dependent oxidoreductase [Deltaproteobacteria bacterium]|nr:FAD-dependent oxidoreductase [Deltaproteobacteria bacterium]
MPPPPTFDVRLASARLLAPNVRELGFVRADGAPFEFQAGQWVSLVLPLAEGEARRAYSIASPPAGDGSFEIAVTKVASGVGSSFLHELPVGGTLRAIGPQGFFTRTIGEPSLFVGTGTGVTPLRSMIRDALAHGERAPMTLVVGVRTEADCLYRGELEALAAAHPTFRVLYTLSRPSEGWSGLSGYVQTHVERLYRELEGGAGAPVHVYACGLERMVGAVRDLLRKQMGVDRKRVHSERYD